MPYLYSSITHTLHILFVPNFFSQTLTHFKLHIFFQIFMFHVSNIFHPYNYINDYLIHQHLEKNVIVLYCMQHILFQRWKYIMMWLMSIHIIMVEQHFISVPILDFISMLSKSHHWMSTPSEPVFLGIFFWYKYCIQEQKSKTNENCHFVLPTIMILFRKIRQPQVTELQPDQRIPGVGMIIVGILALASDQWCYLWY